MNLPVLAKELSLALRRPKAFVVAGLAYGSSVFAVTLAWGLITSNPTIPHEVMARLVFYSLLLGSALGLSFDEALLAAASLAGEREGGTEDLLRTAPRSATLVVLEKWLAPMLLQALFLSGMLPFLSLLFFLGGISLSELSYQGLNLLIWLNTCIAIGIHSSARSRSVRSAATRTATAIVWLGLILPAYCLALAWLSASKTWALEAFLWPVLVGFLQRLGDLFSLLVPVSPVWLFDSWFAVEGGPLLFTKDPRMLGACPALTAWGIHLLLQSLLLVDSARVWKRFREPTAERKRAIADLFARRKGAAPSGVHPEGWRAFFVRERGGYFRRIDLFHPLPVLAMALTACGASWYVGESALVPLSAAAMLISLGISLRDALGSFQREVRNSTAPLLVMTPIRHSQLLLGKWVFYSALAGIFQFAAWLPAFALAVFRWSQGEPVGYWPWTCYTGLAAFAICHPLAVLLSLIVGFLVKRPGPQVLLIVLAYLGLLTNLAVLAGIPLVLLAIFIAHETLQTVHGARLEQDQRRRVVAVLALWAFFLLPVGLSVWLTVNLFEGFSAVFLPVNSLIAMPLLARLIWVLLDSQSPAWWRDHLLGVPHRTVDTHRARFLYFPADGAPSPGDQARMSFTTRPWTSVRR